MHVIRLWNLNNARDENKQAQIVLKGYFGGVFEVGCIRYSSVVMDPSLSHSVLIKKVDLNTLGLCFLSSPCLLPVGWVSDVFHPASCEFWSILISRPCFRRQTNCSEGLIQKTTVTPDIVVMLVLCTFMLTVIRIDSVLSLDGRKLCGKRVTGNKSSRRPLVFCGRWWRI